MCICEQWWLHCTSQWGWQTPLSEHVYGAAGTFKMTEQVEQWICIEFLVKFEHSSSETILMIQKAAAMGNWWLAASSRQRTCSCIMQRFFLWNLKSPRWLSPTTAQIWCPVTSGFSQTKTTFHTGEISGLWWDSGKYNRAADGNSNKEFCRVFWTVEEVLGELHEPPRCPLWRGLRCHCPMYSVSCFFYLPQ